VRAYPKPFELDTTSKMEFLAGEGTPDQVEESKKEKTKKKGNFVRPGPQKKKKTPTKTKKKPQKKKGKGDSVGYEENRKRRTANFRRKVSGGKAEELDAELQSVVSNGLSGELLIL